MAKKKKKNVHGKGGVRFKEGYTSSKRKNMIRNVLSQLVLSGSVEVTFETAKRVQPKADRLVTYAKKGDISSRKNASKWLRSDAYLDSDGLDPIQRLFKVYGPKFKNRNGGYTRVLKLESRRGDNAKMALISFVD